jgi:hypothetical protein
MLYGYDYNQFDGQPEEPLHGGSQELSWLDYILLSNPQGVMKVLSSYGYTGYLAPQDQDEMMEVCQELMSKYNEQAVIDLLKSHPLYDTIAEISSQNKQVSFKNATGDSVIAIIKTINYQSLLENALIIIGAFYLANMLWMYISKE